MNEMDDCLTLIALDDNRVHARVRKRGGGGVALLRELHSDVVSDEFTTILFGTYSSY